MANIGEMRQDIINVMQYRSGEGLINTVYVGGMATAHVLRRLGGSYGKDSVPQKVQDATTEQIEYVHKYLEHYIKHMKENPIEKCSECGQITKQQETQLTPKDYQTALDVQTACNLSGVVKSFNKVLKKLWAEARAHGKGTDYVNEHPISRLYAEQIAHLTGRGMIEDTYNLACNYCERKAQEG